MSSRLGVLFVVVALIAVRTAVAHAQTARVLPTTTPIHSCDGCVALHQPDPDGERALAEWAEQVEAAIVDAVQDLGLTLDVSEHNPESISSDAELLELAGDGWLFAPRIEKSRGGVIVRIVAVTPESKVLLERLERSRGSDLEMLSVVMMRDLVERGRSGLPAAAPPRPAPRDAAVVEKAHSKGRAVLALNSAALGGYMGYALQRAGGSEDPRLTYPLIALGTGVGLGASMIVADEWDVGVGDAWYVTAGTWWPAISALLLAKSYDKDDSRFIFGLAGAAGGLGLTTAALTLGEMSDGGAVLAHSGGAYGLLFGGLVELAVDGTTNGRPTRGMGYGAGLGFLAAATVARFAPSTTASRVLLLDLGAALGGLTGAALASPLVFDDPSRAQNRVWLSAIAGGMLVGGTTAFLLTRPKIDATETETTDRAPPRWLPSVGAVATDVAGDPSYGASVFGVW